jgi:predicted transcriptional regulator
LLSNVQRNLLSILQDETRMKILTILSDFQVHPEILVQETGLSRTAIEKHLKQLLNFGLLERRAQTYPRLRYIYSLSPEAEVLIETIGTATEQYRDNMVSKWTDELTQIEQGYVFGALQKQEFEELKINFKERINGLED